VAVTADLAKYLDKAYEDATLEEVLAAPVSALAGVTDDDAEALRRAFRIRTVADLGRNKYFTVAHALAQLGGRA
jgi:hypothetical protein